MANDQLYAKKGDIIIRCDTVEQMEAISEILNKMPNRFLLRLGKMCVSGHGKEVTIILVTLAGIMLAVGALFSRKRIKKFINRRIAPMIAAVEETLVLPWRSEIEDVPHEDAPEDECCEEDDELPEETAPPTRKERSELFLDEFGPIPELPRSSSSLLSAAPLATRWR